MQWGWAAGASLLGAIFDLRTRRIPNRLTVPVFVAALGWAVWVAGLAGLADAVSGSLLVSAPYVVLFLLASGGAGDAKLMAAVGAWLGVINGLIALVCVAAAGVIMAVILAAAQKRLRQVLSSTVTAATGAWVQLLAGGRLADTSIGIPAPGRMQRMPYGPAIFLGVCVAAIGTYLWRQS
jgi:prepilin peptidase CpaA